VNTDRPLLVQSLPTTSRPHFHPTWPAGARRTSALGTPGRETNRSKQQKSRPKDRPKPVISGQLTGISLYSAPLFILIFFNHRQLYFLHTLRCVCTHTQPPRNPNYSKTSPREKPPPTPPARTPSCCKKLFHFLSFAQFILNCLYTGYSPPSFPCPFFWSLSWPLLAFFGARSHLLCCSM
jgi:hypothetical protein